MSDSVPVDTTVMDILSEALREPADGLLAEPVLAAHAWDSMTSLEVLAQLEGQLEIVLDLRSFHAVRTVGELIGLVRMAAATESRSP